MSQFACVDQPAFLEILNTTALPWQKPCLAACRRPLAPDGSGVLTCLDPDEAPDRYVMDVSRPYGALDASILVGLVIEWPSHRFTAMREKRLLSLILDELGLSHKTVGQSQLFRLSFHFWLLFSEKSAMAGFFAIMNQCSLVGRPKQIIFKRQSSKWTDVQKKNDHRPSHVSLLSTCYSTTIFTMMVPSFIIHTATLEVILALGVTILIAMAVLTIGFILSTVALGLAIAIIAVIFIVATLFLVLGILAALALGFLGTLIPPLIPILPIVLATILGAMIFAAMRILYGFTESAGLTAITSAATILEGMGLFPPQ